MEKMRLRYHWVEITSCKQQSFWYAKKIGKVFIVRESPVFSDWYAVINIKKDSLGNIVIGYTYAGLGIDKEDAEVLKCRLKNPDK